MAIQILYKLTDHDGYTRRGEFNQTLWGPNVTHSGTGEGELCGPGYIHAYTHPLLAILLNPIHANIVNPRLWECEGEIVKNDRGLKCGCVSLTTIKEISIPIINTEQRIKFAILCGMEIYAGQNWKKWANDWLSGKDRSARAAARAAYAARAAARAAAYAADAAADAAYAAYAADAYADNANYAAAYAAYAYAAYAAHAAAYAAYAAAHADNANPIDLIKLATLAMDPTQ